MRNKMKWNESGFRPPLCTYRLNWARRTSWGWWDDCDDTVLQTQDSKFEPWRSEAEHATSRSRRLPTILTFTRGWGRNNFISFKPPRPGTEPRTLAWKAAVLTTTLGPPPALMRELPVWGGVWKNYPPFQYRNQLSYRCAKTKGSMNEWNIIAHTIIDFLVMYRELPSGSSLDITKKSIIVWDNNSLFVMSRELPSGSSLDITKKSIIVWDHQTLAEQYKITSIDNHWLYIGPA